MSENNDKIPYIRWGECKSKEKSSPDILELQVLDTETSETEYSTNVKVEQKTIDGWKEANLPLKSHDSDNASLLQKWQAGIKDGLIKKGKKFAIRTWLGLSKNNRPIRRFELEF